MDLQMSVVRADVVHSLKQGAVDANDEWLESRLELDGWDTSSDPAYVKRDTEDHLGFLVNQTTSVRCHLVTAPKKIARLSSTCHEHGRNCAADGGGKISLECWCIWLTGLEAGSATAEAVVEPPAGYCNTRARAGAQVSACVLRHAAQRGAHCG